MTNETYDLKELCREAGITPRTVHFYIQRGLLPPSGSLGPGARYGQGHLERLKLIKLLQKEHLPLSEIRRRIEVLDDAKVQELVQTHSLQKPPASSSAAQYIRSVLDGSWRISSHVGSTRSHPNRGLDLRDLVVGHAHGFSHSSERSQWERIFLDPDVELHIRRPLSRSQNKKIEAIIQFARETLKEE